MSKGLSPNVHMGPKRQVSWSLGCLPIILSRIHPIENACNSSGTFSQLPNGKVPSNQGVCLLDSPWAVARKILGVQTRSRQILRGGKGHPSATRFFNDADTDQGAGEVREVGVGAWIQDVGLRAADAELRIQDHGSRTADPAPQIQV